MNFINSMKIYLYELLLGGLSNSTAMLLVPNLHKEAGLYRNVCNWANVSLFVVNSRIKTDGNNPLAKIHTSKVNQTQTLIVTTPARKKDDDMISIWK